MSPPRHAKKNTLFYALQHAALMVEMEDSFAGANANPNPNANANASGGNSVEARQWREVDMSRDGSAARPIMVDDDGDDETNTSTVGGDGASGTPGGLWGHTVHAADLSPGDQVRLAWPGVK